MCAVRRIVVSGVRLITMCAVSASLLSPSARRRGVFKIICVACVSRDAVLRRLGVVFVGCVEYTAWCVLLVLHIGPNINVSRDADVRCIIRTVLAPLLSPSIYHAIRSVMYVSRTAVMCNTSAPNKTGVWKKSRKKA